MSDLSVSGNRIGVRVINAKQPNEVQGVEGVPPVPALKSQSSDQESSSQKGAENPLDKSTRLSIQRDDATGRYVFRSIDPQTGDVLMQYPTEEMLSQIARVREITGLTVDEGV
ncbi:MAG: hypothetical protein EXR08_00535 [Alphaproteobacteria bacterium]|nr:hypothetical protein [Alphaproteobacteria bacterium]